MAILLDAGARAAIARRGARGHDRAIVLQMATVPHGGRRLSACWGSPRRLVHEQARPRVRQRISDVDLYLDERIAHYARWHDVTVTAWHLGLLEYLMIVREPIVLRQMIRWERAHPALG